MRPHKLPNLWTSPHKDQVRWGAVDRARQSGYDFEGSRSVARFDGAKFELGTLIHHNRSIPAFRPWQFWVNLHVSLTFHDGHFQRELVIHLRHEETPNRPRHSNDRVIFPELKKEPPETLYREEDDSEYEVRFLGFFAAEGNSKTPLHVLNTPEKHTKKAKLYARLERVSDQKG